MPPARLTPPIAALRQRTSSSHRPRPACLAYGHRYSSPGMSRKGRAQGTALNRNSFATTLAPSDSFVTARLCALASRVREEGTAWGGTAAHQGRAGRGINHGAGRGGWPSLPRWHPWAVKRLLYHASIRVRSSSVCITHQLMPGTNRGRAHTVRARPRLQPQGRPMKALVLGCSLASCGSRSSPALSSPDRPPFSSSPRLSASPDSQA